MTSLKSSPFKKGELLPQSEMLEVGKKKGNLLIGIPKETYFQEKRICLTPDAVSVLCAQNNQVVIESGAGKEAGFSDKAYSDVGAKISSDKKEVYRSHVVLKVEPPSEEEFKFLQPNSILFSAIQLKMQQPAYLEVLKAKKITAVAYEFMEDAYGVCDIARSLSEIAGRASILIAAEIMSHFSDQKALLGGIAGVAPAQVIILGAGTVGTFAAQSALGLGAFVKVFDNSTTRLIQLQQSLRQPIYTSTFQSKELENALLHCDVAIGAIKGTNRSPILVSESIVERMKKGSVIIDVSIDRGGCFETSEVTTHKNPTFIKHGVVHYGVPNIPSKYSRTASKSISNIFLPYLLNIIDKGGFENALRQITELQKGTYIYNGIVTHKTVAKWFSISHTDIHLLLY